MMTEMIQHTCNICLRTNYNSKIVESSQYLDMFNKIFKNTDCHLNLWLCFWCRSVFKKINNLLDITKKYANISDNKYEKNIDNSLSFHSNEHIDIPPIGTDFVEKDIKEEKIDLTCNTELNNESTQESKFGKNNIKNEITQENVQELESQKNNRLKKEKLEELNFDVIFLSKDEQTKEIEDKKRSEKYKSCNYKCEYCGIGFYVKDDFEEHKRRHTKFSGPHTCNICHLRFKTAEVLSHHTLAHRRRFTCRSCGTKLKRWSHCVPHRGRCGNSGTPAVCKVCAKIFGDQHTLKIHMKQVHANKNYQCEQCDKTFSTKQRLKVHVRSHTGLKPYSCTVCPRSFSTMSNLRTHAAVHSDDKRHYCVECNKYYKTEKSLKRHFSESTKHCDDGFSCKECSKKFATRRNLDKHVEMIHLLEHRCTQCSKVFSTKSNLSKHVRCVHSAGS